MLKIIKKSIPGSFTVFLDMVIVMLFQKYFEITPDVINYLAVLLTATCGFIHLYHISKPFNYLRAIMFSLLIILFNYGIFFQREFFSLTFFNGQIGLIYFLLVIFSLFSYKGLIKITNYLFDKKKIK